MKRERQLVSAKYQPPTKKRRITPKPVTIYDRKGLSLEKKFSDIGTATYSASTTGSFTLLHFPQLGNDYNNRIGRKTMIKSIFIRGSVSTEVQYQAINTAVQETSQTARMILFVDNQPNAAAPNLTDLLVSADSYSQLNPNNRDRFKIIRDEVFCFGATTIVTTATQSFAYSGGPTIYPVKTYVKADIETIFNANNAGTIADITSGAVYMLWVSEVAAGSSNAQAKLSTRVRYIDV